MDFEVNLHVNKSGYYELRWTERDVGAGRGRSRSVSCRTKNRREAEIFKTAWEQQRRELEAAQVGTTVGEICSAYVARHVVKNNSGSQTNEYALRSVRGWFEDHDISALSSDEVEAYVDHRLLSVASGTVRRELGSLRAALNWAASKSVKIIQPSEVPEFDLPPDGPPRTDYLEADEADRLFDHARGLSLGDRYWRFRRVGLFTCIALETAAREAAVRGLDWGRVNLNSGLIDFRDPNMRITKKRRVPVPISDRLMPVLVDAWDRREEYGGQFVLGHNGAVRKQFERIVRGQDFKTNSGDRPHIHDMRRTWATLRAMWGVPLEEVAAILGDTLEVVQKHYAIYQPGFGRSAVNARPERIAAE